MTTARVWSVTTTTPTEAEAKSLARALVAEKLAASAEIAGPSTSVFWHLGELGEGQEWRVTLRTSDRVRDRLASQVAVLHQWESPEVTAVPIDWCTDSYAAWVDRVTANSS
ncbi:divalent-cation tolerance protein CutA [Nocardia asteroides]|uniref:divalent-cation tolerance protein CutA n=1 Tax=Nocardia asteroides TaxID=1824 RepID=UPI001E2F369E|nr:divalent cation tolerance protein CutA [Nocardia asteroides]UGT59390.1 divalent-cation tolerance protein CutA [Nocardia asteroides]